jgi:hypothetical protein
MLATRATGDAYVGHLAGLFIHLAAEAILAAVRFIRSLNGQSASDEVPDIMQRSLSHSPTALPMDKVR